MQYFDGFAKKAMVIIPPHHELRRRRAEKVKQDGYEVPQDALNAMKGIY